MKTTGSAGQPGRSPRRARRLALSIAVTTGVLGALSPNAFAANNVVEQSTATSARASAPARETVKVNGKTISQVLHNGHLVSLNTFQAEADAAPTTKQAGKNTSTIVMDSSAIASGYFVAFDSDAATNEYLKQHNLGQVGVDIPETPAAEVRAWQLRDAPAVPERATLKSKKATRASAASACGLPNHSARMYDGTSCGGDYFSVGWNQYIAGLGAYGWTDRFSSAAIGDCIANMQLWKDSSRGGTRWVLGGGDVYTIMPYVGMNKALPSSGCRAA